MLPRLIIGTAAAVLPPISPGWLPRVALEVELGTAPAAWEVGRSAAQVTGIQIYRCEAVSAHTCKAIC